MFGIDLVEIIRTVGYTGILAIIFSECGLFFGFFLPGDSLLLTAGLLAVRGELDLTFLLITLPIAAIVGDNVGYWFGRKAGPPIFNREGSLLFRRKNLLAAKAFFDKHGVKTIIIARFIPFIRTFVPIVSGAVEMPYRKYFFFDCAGGLLWTLGMTLAGYYLGQSFPPEVLDKYFLLIVLAVIFLSAIPAMIHMWNEYRHEVFARVLKILGREPEKTAE
jgi:membrane-associated protein